MPFADVGDARIRYEVVGEGPPLLMVMGFALDHQAWMLQVPHLRKRFTCVLMDNRGAGQSAAPPGPYRMERLAEDAVAVLDAAGVARAHVLGISMGGMMSLHLAASHPERVDRLVLACTSAGMREHGLQVADDVGRSLGFDVPWHEAASGGAFDLVAFARVLSRYVFSDAFFATSGEMLSQMMGMLTARLPQPPALLAQFEAILGHEVTSRLPTITAPALVITGTEDRLVPPDHSRRIAEALPAARLETVEGGSHAFNVERPAEFNRAVLRFLGER